MGKTPPRAKNAPFTAPPKKKRKKGAGRLPAVQKQAQKKGLVKVPEPAGAGPGTDPAQPKERARRTPKNIIEGRILDVAEKIAQGWFPHQIAKDFYNRYGIGERQVSNYLRMAYERIREANKEQYAIYKDQWMLMSATVFQGATLEKDYRAAAAVLDHMAKVGGLYDPPEPEGGVGDPLSDVPSDAKRNPTDRNYQVQVMCRDVLARRAARGDVKAASEAAAIAKNLYDDHGPNRATVTDKEKEAAIAAAKAHMISQNYTGHSRPEPDHSRLDDFEGIASTANPEADKDG